MAEIENEKERMKERRGRKRKEEGEKKLEKNFSRTQTMGIFSAHWKGPIRLSPQLPWLHSGNTSLFPFVCSLSDSKHHMEMTYVALTADLGHDRSSLSLIGDQGKSSFCECQQWSYLQSKHQMLERWANVQTDKTTLIKRSFPMKS